MSATFIITLVAVIVATAAVTSQFMNRRPRGNTTPTPPTLPPAPEPIPPSAQLTAIVTPESPTPGSAPELPRILVDTSAIIDGRIADIAAAGFVPGRLVVPRFVLAELQNIADSEDAMRRGRGRRGLDVLSALRELTDLEVEIIDDDVPKVREVDAKLVILAQKFSCNVLTTDYNLNRVAQIQGVRVLNVNELSNAIRPVVLPGEELLVRVVQPGKERHQGVGYLADGTMIVVENGDKLIGQEVATEVTRVFQTVAGKMIFAAPRSLAMPTTTGAASAEPSPAVLSVPPRQPDQVKPIAKSSTHPLAPPAGRSPQTHRPRRDSQADLENRLIAATNTEPNTHRPQVAPTTKNQNQLHSKAGRFSQTSESKDR